MNLCSYVCNSLKSYSIFILFAVLFCLSLYHKTNNYYMELTLFVKKGRKEVINRVELDDVAARIKDELAREHVRQLRMHYHLMKPRRQEDGSIVTRMNEGINLPRLCFAALFENAPSVWKTPHLAKGKTPARNPRFFCRNVHPAIGSQKTPYETTSAFAALFFHHWSWKPPLSDRF